MGEDLEDLRMDYRDKLATVTVTVKLSPDLVAFLDVLVQKAAADRGPYRYEAFKRYTRPTRSSVLRDLVEERQKKVKAPPAPAEKPAAATNGNGNGHAPAKVKAKAASRTSLQRAVGRVIDVHTVLAARRLVKGGRSFREAAAELGVSRTSLQRAVGRV